MQILEKKQRKIMHSGLDTTKGDAQNLFGYMQSLIGIVSRQKRTASNCLENMKNSKIGFVNMNTASQKEMVDLSIEIHRIIKTINSKLDQIEHKTDEIKALQYTALALDTAALAAGGVGGPAGWIIAGVTLAASLSVHAAQSQLEEDVQELTQQMQAKSTELSQKYEEQGGISLDTETRDFFVDRLITISSATIHIRKNVVGKIPKWQNFAGLLLGFVDLIEAKQSVLDEKIMRFFRSDLKEIEEFNGQLENYAANF